MRTDADTAYNILRWALPKARRLKFHPSKHRLQFSYGPTTSKTNTLSHFVQSLFCFLLSNCSGNPFSPEASVFHQMDLLTEFAQLVEYFNSTHSSIFHIDERHSVNTTFVLSIVSLPSCLQYSCQSPWAPFAMSFWQYPSCTSASSTRHFRGKPSQPPSPLLGQQPCVGLPIAGALQSHWPRKGWAGRAATPVHLLGVSKGGPSLPGVWMLSWAGGGGPHSGRTHRTVCFVVCTESRMQTVPDSPSTHKV